MKISPTKFSGVYLIEPQLLKDVRGFFTRLWDSEEFKKLNLPSQFNQSSLSMNEKKGTLRGIHFQEAPYDEHKLIHVVSGKIFDVLVDLRTKSTTYLQWISFELDSKKPSLIYITPGIAHGFQTLEDHTSIIYHMVEPYSKDHAKGYRYDDPAFNIQWPLNIPENGIHPKDLEFPKFK